MKQSKKYIAVDTWNGVDYASDNGVEIRIFDTKQEADAYCKTEAYKNEEEDVMVVEKVKNGYEFYDISEDGVDDSGSYRYYPLPKDAYAVEILCNVNEVRILNQVEFAKALAEREQEIRRAELDRDEVAESTDDGIFYMAIDDYDFQYRRLSDVRGIDDNLMKEITLTKQEVDLAIKGMTRYLNYIQGEMMPSTIVKEEKAIERLISVLKTNQI